MPGGWLPRRRDELDGGASGTIHLETVRGHRARTRGKINNRVARLTCTIRKLAAGGLRRNDGLDPGPAYRVKVSDGVFDWQTGGGDQYPFTAPPDKAIKAAMSLLPTMKNIMVELVAIVSGTASARKLKAFSPQRAGGSESDIAQKAS